MQQQVGDEARQLLRFLPGIRTQVVVGGTNQRTDLKRFREGWPDILVGTPGRLNDHLENSGLARAMAGPDGLQLLILDEADQLLEMGFRPALKQMLRALPPKESRQCLLFSATMPKDVRAVAADVLRQSPAPVYVDTVGEEQSTHARVPQFVTVHKVEPVPEKLYRRFIYNNAFHGVA